MNLTEKARYKRAFQSFIDIDRFSEPFSATLTLKQSVVTHHKHLKVHSRITHERAVQNFRHFMNLLNRKVYGNSYRRHGKRLQVVPILEGGGFIRLHYHCVIDCPKPELSELFPKYISECWLQTDYGYDEIDIQPNSDEGWVRYISKFRGKPEYDLSIDWENFHQS